MSFNKDNFIPTSTSANSNAGKVFQYKDDKTLNEMLVPGYFNLAAESYGLKDKDVVMLIGNDGVSTSQAAVIDGADVTLTDSVSELIDSVNKTIETSSAAILDFSTYLDNQDIPGYTLWGGTVGATALPRIKGGKMVFEPVENGAGYAHKLHDSTVKRLFGKFSLSSTVLAGSVVLIAWENDIEVTHPVIPNGACHLVITPTGWEYAVVVGNAVTIVDKFDFIEPLTADEEYTVEVILDPVAEKAFLSLPDGTTAIVEHPQIGLESKYACFELFKLVAGDANGSFSSILSSTNGDTHQTPPPPARVFSLQYAPTPSENIVVPTSSTLINAGLILPCIASKTGKLLVELCGPVNHHTTSNMLWTLFDANAGALSNQSVSRSVVNGYVNASFLITGRNPFEKLDIQWQHWSTVASSALFTPSNSNGTPAVMKATMID